MFLVLITIAFLPLSHLTPCSTIEPHFRNADVLVVEPRFDPRRIERETRYNVWSVKPGGKFENIEVHTSNNTVEQSLECDGKSWTLRLRYGLDPLLTLRVQIKTKYLIVLPLRIE